MLIDDPAVQSVAVLAVPDELHDEEVMACIVPMPGMVADQALVLEILERARPRLARHKLPAWMAFVDRIPVTGTQKIQKHQIFEAGIDLRRISGVFDLRALKKRG